jgi:Fe-S-cluster-containing hydrogenase component 2
MEIIRQSKACRGCRVCEIICAYHQKKVFSPQGGAIRVKKDNRTGEIHWCQDETCDLCLTEDEPLCVRFCSYGALRVVKKDL